MEAYLGVENQFLFLFCFGGFVWICYVLRVEWDKECGYLGGRGEGLVLVVGL